jgi:hypothetical protein
MGKLSHIVKAIDKAKQAKLKRDDVIPKAQEITNRLKESGFEIIKEQSAPTSFGQSYYITAQAKDDLGRVKTYPVRISDHSVGTNRMQESFNVFDSESADSAINKIINDRDSFLASSPKNKQELSDSLSDRFSESERIELNSYRQKRQKALNDINNSELTQQQRAELESILSETNPKKNPQIKRLEQKEREFNTTFERISKGMDGKATTKQMAGASTVGATGLGLQAFIEKRKQRANSLVNRTIEKAQYYGEPAAALATGIGAGLFGDAVGGIAGLASLPFVGHERAGQITQGIQDSIPSYIPESEAGMQGLTDLVDTATEEVGALYKDAVDYWGIDPIANFEQSAEALHEKGLNVPAAILKGAPHIL